MDKHKGDKTGEGNRGSRISYDGVAGSFADGVPSGAIVPKAGPSMSPATNPLIADVSQIRAQTARERA
jgi:hypothetical protein